MTRRDFITLLGGAAAWPLAARAQQPKRVGVLMNGDASGPINQSNLATIIQGLRKLGWTDDQNLQIEVRWSAADPKFMEAYATDLVRMFKPDVLLAGTTGNLVALQRVTNTIPIVFIGVSDPVVALRKAQFQSGPRYRSGGVVVESTALSGARTKVPP